MNASIVGLGSTPYYYRGESAPQTLYELIGTAALLAAADAGVSITEVDGLALYANGFEPGLITEMLGIRELNFASTVAAQGGGSAGILDLAAMAIASGRARYVLCIGACQQSRNRYGLTLANLAATPDSIFHKTAGLKGPGHALALLAQRHMHLYGTRREALAEVVMASRDYAVTQPGAIRKRGLTIDEYMTAPMMADPLCRLDFCLEADGALAFLVTSAERARDLRAKPVHIAASAHGGEGAWGRAFFSLSMPDELFTSAGGEHTARRLYAQAGVTPADIDVALLYDHFSPLVLMQLEDYGFCARGEGGPLVESGAIRRGGAIPVNPHGGHLSEAYVIGMTHIREAVQQLRGEAANQIPGAKLALVTGGPAPVPMSGAILRN
ncbi:MAG: thiolase [Novosphingobium sp.]